MPLSLAAATEESAFDMRFSCSRQLYERRICKPKASALIERRYSFRGIPLALSFSLSIPPVAALYDRRIPEAQSIGDRRYSFADLRRGADHGGVTCNRKYLRVPNEIAAVSDTVASRVPPIPVS
jgi:hypothetical protein